MPAADEWAWLITPHRPDGLSRSSPGRRTGAQARIPMALPGSPRRSEPITVTCQRDTHRDASWRASFVVMSGLVLWLTPGSPNGVRTRASTLRGWCPRPLDDGAKRRQSRRPPARRCRRLSGRVWRCWPAREVVGFTADGPGTAPSLKARRARDDLLCYI